MPDWTSRSCFMIFLERVTQRPTAGVVPDVSPGYEAGLNTSITLDAMSLGCTPGSGLKHDTIKCL